jgi:hypothetical protein
MNDRNRLDQLRGLLDRLEHMPASGERDWMLGEVRGRAVDVETGMPLTPLRAPTQHQLEAEIAAERSPRTPPVKTRRKRPSRRAQRPKRVHFAARTPQVVRSERGHERVVDLLEQGGVMCLDDAPATATGAGRPWSGGLRG